MFEAITQTQPEDYQSLEILREAYTKIGRHDEALRTSRKLAEAYFNAGSYTPALQQCEMILTREPNAPEILAMLGEIEQRLQNFRRIRIRSEEHTSELQSLTNLVCRLLLEKKKKTRTAQA